MRYLLLIISLIISTVRAQTITWAHQYSVLSSTSTSGNSICVDSKENVYIAGMYSANQGNNGSFLAKYSSSGSLMWSTNLINWNLMIAIGPNDTIVATGIDSSGYYVSKYDTSGNLLQKINLIDIFGGENGKIRDITVDNLNNYYVSGFFQDTMSLGSQTIYGTTGQWNLFVAKFNKRDSCLWAKTSNHSDVYECFVKTDINQNVYLSGCFLDTLSCGTSSIVGVNMNGFVCKMNSSGTTQWLYNIGNAPGEPEVVTSIDIDKNGGVFVTGSYSAPLTLGSTTLTPSASTSFNNTEIFLFKLTPTGLVVWAQSIGGPSIDFSHGLNVNIEGDVYMSGQYINSITIGTLSLNSVANSGNIWPWEAFVAKFDGNGNTLWAIQSDCNSNEGVAACTGICSNKQNIFTTGSFSGNADFQAHPITCDSTAMFVTKITDLGVTGFNNKELFQKDILVFPNPTKGLITIKVAQEEIIQSVVLYDAFGREALHVLNNNLWNTIHLDLSSYPKGIYMLCVVFENYKSVKKITLH